MNLSTLFCLEMRNYFIGTFENKQRANIHLKFYPLWLSRSSWVQWLGLFLGCFKRERISSTYCPFHIRSLRNYKYILSFASIRSNRPNLIEFQVKIGSLLILKNLHKILVNCECNQVDRFVLSTLIEKCLDCSLFVLKW